MRAGVTLFDALLTRAFGERLADHLPIRVLPISAEPPRSLDLLVDREFQRIADLLKPGRRASAEAMARIRSLLATESFTDPDAAEVRREADVRRVAEGIRDGKSRSLVFPKLSGLSSDIQGSGLTVEVRMVKSGGLPVTYTNEASADVSAIRTVISKKFYMGPHDLADRCSVSRNKATALRRHLGLDANDDHFSHRFVLGKTKNAALFGQCVASDEDRPRDGGHRKGFGRLTGPCPAMQVT